MGVTTPKAARGGRWRRAKVFQKLIVGIDFTGKSDRAIEAALRLARGIEGATVVLVHAVSTMAEVQGTQSAGAEIVTTLEGRLKARASELTAATGVHCDYGVVDGPDAATAMVSYLKRWGGDMVVVGTEGRTGLSRVLIGSVAEKIVQTSPVPVLVIGPASA
jgi:nucleotide-binding universal stress UspA family protein